MSALGRRNPMRDYFTRREVLQCAAALCGVRFARGQDAPVFSADVKVVNVLATVRNKTGSLAGNLNQDDFSLSEDGRPQTIRYFARESDLPLTLGLLVDTSGSQRRVLDAERGASLRFLDQVVREKKDQVFIMQFDSAVQMRQALTSSVGKLDDALAYVDTETQRQLRMQHGGGTLLYDAVAQASDEVMKKLSGRKALIVLSDGVDLGSYGTLKDAVEAARARRHAHLFDSVLRPWRLWTFSEAATASASCSACRTKAAAAFSKFRRSKP